MIGGAQQETEAIAKIAGIANCYGTRRSGIMSEGHAVGFATLMPPPRKEAPCWRNAAWDFLAENRVPRSARLVTADW